MNVNDDIICLQETFLDFSIITDDKLSLPGYSMMGADHPKVEYVYTIKNTCP